MQFTDLWQSLLDESVIYALGLIVVSATIVAASIVGVVRRFATTPIRVRS